MSTLTPDFPFEALGEVVRWPITPIEQLTEQYLVLLANHGGKSITFLQFGLEQLTLILAISGRGISNCRPFIARDCLSLVSSEVILPLLFTRAEHRREQYLRLAES